MEIALGLRKLVPGWVESYTGPEDLIAAVDAQARPTADGLRDRVMEFAERVEHEVTEPDRRRWLLGQLNAISTALLWLAGEPFSYTALFERCHGAAVELMSDRQFEQAHALLDSALPGRGGVAPRYRAWRETQLVAPERLQAGLELLAAEMRRRSRERYALPEDEHVIWDLVSGVPWAGNADYLGRRATRVRINVDLPISSPRLLELVCHEASPGHHTESVCKDASLIRPAGRDEFSVFVYPSPQAVMSEGLASHAIEALLGPDAERVAADCLQQRALLRGISSLRAVHVSLAKPRGRTVART